MYHNDPVFAEDGVKHLRHEIAPLLHSRIRYREKYKFDVSFMFERIEQLERMYCSKEEYMEFYEDLLTDIIKFKKVYDVHPPNDDGEYQDLLYKTDTLLHRAKDHPESMMWQQELEQLKTIDFHSPYIHQILEDKGDKLYKLYVTIDDALPLNE